MSDILKTSEFDPLIDHIVEIGHDHTGRYYAVFRIPPALTLDLEKVKAIFDDDDATLGFNSVHGIRQGTLKGWFRDPALGKYLMNRRCTYEVKFDFELSAFDKYRTNDSDNQASKSLPK